MDLKVIVTPRYLRRLAPFTDGNKALTDALYVAADKIEELEARLEAFGWVPVSERLPENYVAVLVFRTHGSTSEYFIDYICNTGNWIFSDDLPWEITHWMPLPDPPQQEEK